MPPQQTSIISNIGRDAARPTPPSTRSVLSALKRIWAAFQEQRRRECLRASLQYLSDRELMDMGLTRGEIDYITAQGAIERVKDNARALWGLGGL